MYVFWPEATPDSRKDRRFQPEDIKMLYCYFLVHDSDGSVIAKGSPTSLTYGNVPLRIMICVDPIWTLVLIV